MSILLQVSDSHFGTERPPIVAALARLAREQEPDLVVLSGDITQRARPSQFRAARAFVDLLGVPTLAIPGNHDVPLFHLWARLRRPYAHYVTAFGTDLEPTYSSRDMLVLGVNTTRPWRHKHGEVSSAQIERVATQLAAADARQLRVVVVHQPAAVMHAEDVPNRLRGCAAALERWAAAGADLVMGGHIHLPFVMPLVGLVRPMWVVQAGTAVSSRVRHDVPNSVNLLRWGEAAGDERCHIEQWDFSAASESFALATATTITPARA